MVCENATAPLDLDSSQANQCAIQCSLSFSYPDIHTEEISNEEDGDGGKLSVILQQPDNPCVTFNTTQYTPYQILLYTPALHSFSGVRPQAELIVEHVGEAPQAGTSLFICVPISVSNLDNNDSLDSIVQQARAIAPSPGSSGSTGLTLHLQSIIPIAPYFYYEGTGVTGTDCSDGSYVVFGENDGVSMSANDFAVLKSIVSPQTIPLTTNPAHYAYNQSGPKLSEGDETYMECAPTGSSSSSTLVTQKPDTSQQSAAWATGFGEGGWVALLQLVAGVLLFFAIRYLYNYVTGKLKGRVAITEAAAKAAKAAKGS